MTGLQRKTLAEKLYSFLAIAFAVFWLGFLVFKPAVLSALRPGNESSGHLYPLLLLWLAVTFVYGILLAHWERRLPTLFFSLLLFVLCALPRLAVLHFHHYIATNDFANYLLYGQCFVQGNFAPAADLIANYYQMPKMGGLVVFNGLLLHLFGDTLLGMQLANVVMTGLICVALYHLVRPLHEQAAWLTALLWMVYPSNIISTQIPTNHHGAVLFFLLALLLYQKLLNSRNWWQVVGLAAVVGVLLTVSNLIHPSVIIIKLSILCFTFLAVLYYVGRQKKFFCVKNQKLLAAVLLIFLTSTVSQNIAMQQLQQQQIVTDDKEISVLFKLVLGFNTESNGSFSEADYTYIRQLPQEQQAEACLTLLRQRLGNPLDIVQFMLHKTNVAWFARDGYFYWYNEGALQEFSLRMAELNEGEQQQYWQTVRWIDGAQALDIIFVRLVYWLAVAGLLASRRFSGTIENVLFFIPLGWVAVIMLTEMQSRYRYPAMPVFFLLAALGLCALWQWLEKKQGRHGKLKRNAGVKNG